MKSMSVKAITTLNAKYEPKKKENAFVNNMCLFVSMTVLGGMMGWLLLNLFCSVN
jgi:hypothetical protein